MLTIRLKDELEHEIEHIAQRQGLTKSAWVRQLIENALQPERKSPYQLAQDLGLLGCEEGLPEDASERVAELVRERLGAKHSD
ncbi:MAG: hypothetical protein A3B82_06375 [Methylophilales bacterium RIFCSPHIGHO2_02_FULL_57_10]|nr:MAG: hypothetical protein A3B82_06375 [Methylophilales bacterium RIFCSPHIGHO2_02_FULL_57_10]